MFTIHHTETPTKGAFTISLDSGSKAEMTYSKAGNALIIIDHTEVPQEAKGMGLGKALVEAAVQFAREHHLKIMPLCPFAKTQFQRTKDWHDVLS